MFFDTNKLFYNTEPINKEKARKSILDLYQYCNKKSKVNDYWKGFIDYAPVANPEVVFVDGTTELADKVVEDNWTALDRFDDIAHFVTKRGTSSHDRVRNVLSSCLQCNYKRKNKSWDGPLSIAIDYVYVDKENEHRSKYENKYAELVTALWDEVYAAYTFCNTCYVINRPSLVKYNDRGLHCVDGPSLVFRDGTEVYCYEGIEVSKDNLLNPGNMTLEDIHDHSYKYIRIDLCGVDRYLEMCRAWKPDVEGMFAKFFSFPQMNPKPGSWSLREFGATWMGYGNMYEERPYILNISNQDINGEYCLKMEDGYSMLHFPRRSKPMDFEYMNKIFNKKDMKLWKGLNWNGMMGRGPLKFNINFQKGIFSVSSVKEYDIFPSCTRDVAPAWFKAKMFRKQDAIYETDKYGVKYEDGELFYSGSIQFTNALTQKQAEDKSMIYVRNSLFGSEQQLPYYKFDLDLKSDSWEGLLEKWERLAFEWLAME